MCVELVWTPVWVLSVQVAHRLSFTEDAGPFRHNTGCFILDVHQVAGFERMPS